MKICKTDNCNNPVFSHLYCQRHQYMRKDKPSRLNRASNLNDHPSKGINVPPKKNKPLKHKKTGELELFQEIWNERPHKSEISGIPLYSFNVSCFHHILLKSTYPEYRLNKDNIIMLTAQEHLDVHSKPLEDLIQEKYMWNEIQERKNKLKCHER
jgi:hypothetical protein